MCAVCPVPFEMLYKDYLILSSQQVCEAGTIIILIFLDSRETRIHRILKLKTMC